MSGEDPIPVLVLDLFRRPWVYSVQWDGEVTVNGSVLGETGVFGPLWDFFVDSPCVRYIRGSDGEVKCADILLPL